MFISIWIHLSRQQLRASFLSMCCYCMFGQLFYRVAIPICMYVDRIRNQHKKGILYSYYYQQSCFTESRHLCRIRSVRKYHLHRVVHECTNHYLGCENSHVHNSIKQILFSKINFSILANPRKCLLWCMNDVCMYPRHFHTYHTYNLSDTNT